MAPVPLYAQMAFPAFAEGPRFPCWAARAPSIQRSGPSQETLPRHELTSPEAPVGLNRNDLLTLPD